MPTTVQELFRKFDILDFQKVQWEANFKENKQGVYVVSTSSDPNKHLGISENPNFDEQQIQLWINKVEDFLVDNNPATLTNVKNRLAEFWLPDESILYIGKASTRKNGSGISKRIREYFSTTIGDGGPHSGGQWVKSLANLNTLTVYYGVCDDPNEIEVQMLQFFMCNVSKTTLEGLYDKRLPIPFANIKVTRNKSHGFKNQRL